MTGRCLRELQVFGTVPGDVAAGVVADPLRRSQIQVDVAVFAPDEPGRPRRVLSLGEAKWDKVMNSGHLERLRRARDLLAVKGYDTRSRRDSLVIAGRASTLSWSIGPRVIR